MRATTRRISTALGLAAVTMLALASNAQANWTGSLKNVSQGYESTRWKDELYSQITWHGCEAGTPIDGSQERFTAQIWEDISLQPDESYDRKSFTACFNNEVSNGEWTDLPSGIKDYYFQIMDINGWSEGGYDLSVEKFVQDTTKADG
ncbi:hypothetical protein [Streptomyces sp. NPDC006012]|uniref:hypothetical protein n=1 Tax=Streptomyces sp. NPDC006012 TaxID=3364739 RepID=UPI0036918484